MSTMAGKSDEGRSQPVVVRSPADVLRLLVATATLLALLLTEWLFGAAVVGFTHDLLRGLDALGETFITAVVVVTRVVALALLGAGLVVVVVRGHWRVLATAVLGAAAGAAIFAVADIWVETQRAALVELSDVAGPLSAPRFPSSTGLAVVAAVVTAAGPWITRRYRRLGWVLTFGLSAGVFVATPVSAAVGVAIASGWTAGALAVVALGAPSRRPTRESVIDGLRAVGVDLASLEPASVDARGSTPYFGSTADGRPLFVKTLARDERDADLLFRLYRYAMPRNLGDERPFSSLRRAVEHEAFMSLAAAQLGVRTPRIIGLAHAEPEGFTLCYEAVAGRSLDRVDAADLTDHVQAQIWNQLGILRRHRVAHRDLRLANLFLDRDGRIWLIDFGFAELAVSDLLLATDLCELVTSLSTKVGAARAVAGGSAAVGMDALRAALPRLHATYLSGATRTAIKDAPQLLDDIRARLAASAVPGAVST